ncbi:alpha/beta hydrolase family protein [Nonomuraea sp. NPDC050790]|uniref:alpha/beta hydrolase family protein n=1 Tax=Nonomuraea sp. NPDC050790 TaxID=3364371 RepID=UPI003798F37D
MTFLGLSLLEILAVLATVALVLARWLPPPARRPVATAAGAVFAASALVLAVSGLRWPLVPVLAAGGVALAAAVFVRWRERAGRPVRRTRWWVAVPAAVAGLGLVVGGAGASWALPSPVFPKPPGAYAVGTTVVQWTDADRPETFTAEPGDRRTVVVQLWYPSGDTTGTRRSRYLGRTAQEARLVAAGAAGYLGVPGFMLDEVARAHARSTPEAPVARGSERFPVVLFSPGLGGVRTQNTAWAEDLASRGYVVAGIDHPYDSALVVLEDGRAVRTRLAATGDDAEDARRAAGWTAIRAGDLGFVLTQLGRMHGGEIQGPLAGRLDLSRAAATGHSLGGAAALQAARQDSRFAAVLVLDGYPRDPAAREFRQPVLALTHAIAPGEEQDYLSRLTRVLQLSRATGYRLIVPGSAHLTFTDAPLYLPPLPSLIGSSGRAAGPRLTSEVSAAFLGATLRGERTDLASTLSRYGELTTFPP